MSNSFYKSFVSGFLTDCFTGVWAFQNWEW